MHTDVADIVSLWLAVTLVDVLAIAACLEWPQDIGPIAAMMVSLHCAAIIALLRDIEG